jgi:hypothetical protein
MPRDSLQSEIFLPDQTEKLVVALRTFLQQQFDQSPPLESLVRTAARWVLEEFPEAQADESLEGNLFDLREPEQQPDKPPADQQAQVPLSIGDSDSVDIFVSGSETEIRQAIEAAEREPEPEQPEAIGADSIDLGLIATRATLKAESCRIAIERNAFGSQIEQDHPVLGRLEELINKAKSMRLCYLWAFNREKPRTEDADLETIASCYEALSEAALLCQYTESDEDDLDRTQVEQAYALLAQAASALRVALENTWLTRPDQDQDEAFTWLQDRTFTNRIHVDRYMRLDDPADPLQSPDLLARFAQLNETIENQRKTANRINQIIKRIKYHANKLPESGPGDEHDCRKINEGLDELMSHGIERDDQRLAHLLGTLDRESFPEQVCPHTWVSLKLDAVVESKPVKQDSRPESDAVFSVRNALRGTSMVIVGGEPRTEAIERIKKAFDLEEVHWVDLAEHGSSQSMKAPIFRKQVRVVLALIKLAGHLHVESAKAFAKEARKPFVAITAGYNPEQIADAIFKQASGQLEISTLENA